MGLFDKELTVKLTGLKKTVQAIHGVRAIQIRANEVRLHLYIIIINALNEREDAYSLELELNPTFCGSVFLLVLCCCLLYHYLKLVTHNIK